MIINCKTETIRVSNVTEKDREMLIAAGYKDTEQVGVANNEIWTRMTTASEQNPIPL